MKILCSGDHHWNSRGPRFAECKRIHAWMVDVAREHDVDLFISTGDVFDLANSTTEERDAVSDWLIEMAKVCDVLLVDGNHGSASDVELMRKLESIGRIVVETGAGVHDFTAADGQDISIACVAWPDRASLLRAAGGDVDAADQLASVALQNVLRGMGERLSGAPCRLLAMHAMVDGSVTSTGQPLVGAEMHVSLSDLALVGAPIGVLGHVHRAQEFSYGDAQYLYTGSPYRTNYGELEEKSVLLLEYTDAGEWRWKRIPTPAERMFYVRDEWGWDEHSNSFTWLVGMDGVPEATEMVGSSIRLRYMVSADQRANARVAAEKVRQRWLSEGATAVKVEDQVKPVNTARAPEVAQAQTLEAKLGAYWTARGTQPEPERADRLLSMAHKLEVAGEI